MAKADDTSNLAITVQSPSTLISLRRTSQCNQYPGCTTLYLDSSAVSEDLFDTTRRRLESAIGMPSVLDLLDETEEPGENICRITGSLLSLFSDALSLFEAEYACRHRQPTEVVPPGKAGGLSSGAKRGSLPALARQLRGWTKATCPLCTPTQAIPDDDRSFIYDCLSFTLDPHSSGPSSFPGRIAPFDPAKPTLLSTLVRHYEELVDHVRRRFGGWGMTREVVHDVCVQLFERDEKEDVHTPLALLRRISHDTAVSRYHSDRRRTTWMEAVAEPPEVACIAATPMGRHEAGRKFQALVDAIATLPPRCQAVFVMRKIHGIPQAQVADCLGISVKAVGKHLRLGLAACRERFSRGEARPWPSPRNGMGRFC